MTQDHNEILILGTDRDPSRPGLESLDDLAALFEELMPGLVRLAHLLTGSLALAEEAVQDAFVTVYQRRADINKPEQYLRRVVVNNCHSRTRRRGVEKQKLQIVASQSSHADWPPEVDEVWDLLAHLSARQRTALVLRFYEDLTVPAIAEVMEVRPGTVKSLIHRGLAQLKERIEP